MWCVVGFELLKALTLLVECLHMMNSCSYTSWHSGEVSLEAREKRQGHKGGVFWITGLSGSGKTTIAYAVEKRLFDMAINVSVLDGDNVRHGLCSDLRFSPEDRAENLRRIAETAKLFMNAGVVCLCAFISPLEIDRLRVRNIIGPILREIYLACPLEVCIERDPKGYYKLAKEGKIKNYTGLSAPYEPPQDPALTLHTHELEIGECVQSVVDFIYPIVFSHV